MEIDFTSIRLVSLPVSLQTFISARKSPSKLNFVSENDQIVSRAMLARGLIIGLYGNNMALSRVVLISEMLLSQRYAPRSRFIHVINQHNRNLLVKCTVDAGGNC